MKQALFTYIDNHKEEMLSFWEDLVTTESGSDNIEGVNKVSEKIRVLLETAGAKVTLKSFPNAGNMLIAHFDGGNKAPVLFLGHMDTVFKKGTLVRHPFVIKDGLAYGPGILDMKAGLTIACFLAKAFMAVGYKDRPLKIVFAGDEENAHPHSNAPQIIMKEAKGCVAAFNFETGFEDNSFVLGRKGTAIFKLTVTGIGAHAGNNPEQGRSAILEMAHKIIDIQNLTDFKKGYSFNVGTIQGGTVFNAIPDYCEVYVDIRYLDPATVPDLKAKVMAIAAKNYVQGTKTEVIDFHIGLNAMQITEASKQLFSVFAKTCVENDFGTASSKLVGGGSDSAYTIMAGVPTICAVGAKGKNNHTSLEYALVDSLFERAKLVGAMVLKLSEFEK